MTSTIEPVPDRIDQQQLAQQLVAAAGADGVELVGRVGCCGIHFLARPALQPEGAGPEPGSGWSARSAARTNDLDPGEDRRSVRWRWTWSDPRRKVQGVGLSALPRRVVPRGPWKSRPSGGGHVHP